MRWKKQGCIITLENLKDVSWMHSHLQLPVPFKLDNGNYRIYFTTRFEGKSLPTFVELEKDTFNIVHKNYEPLLMLGKPGTFDDSGVMFSSIVNFAGKIYMYYIGWNQQVTVPYQNSIGLAVSEDGGISFRKYAEGPILGRSLHDPIFVASPYVVKREEDWILYYLSCTEWIEGESKREPIYDIRYAMSHDGIHWDVPDNNLCIDGKSEEAIAQPCVIMDGQGYRMWYSTRKTLDYRTNRMNSYRIGYAESLDGYTWIRKDDEAGIAVSENGWDSEMLAYANIIKEEGRYVMFYNGNGFGVSGIGYAVAENE